jgi:hypothetical protein
MTNQDPWFFKERAVAFASLALTKHHDVRLSPGDDLGIDLLVEIRTAGDPTRLRLFGVQLVAYMDLPDVREADERVRSQVGRVAVEAELPLCVFVIGVRKPEGICRWVVAPVVDNGQALLRRDAEAAWQDLDEAEAARLIDQVNLWYDARDGGPTPKGRRRRAKTES